jgi:ParB family chromosome partitioning protein
VSKERRLGRGLAALLGAPFDDPVAVERPLAAGTPAVSSPAEGSSPVADSRSKPSQADILHLNVYEIDDNPFQPRRDFSEPEIVSLAESLKEHDMLQPILVRRVGERFQLISGERRLRAAIRAGWSTVPARLRQADDRLVAELAIVENLQRKDLNPVEKALSFKRYLDEHRCTQDDLAQRLKIDRSTIANLLRLLELPHSLLEAIRKGDVSAGHARALLPLGDEREQVALADRIRTEGLSVRDVERMVSERVAELDGDILALPGVSDGRSSRRARSDQIVSLEQELRRAFGTRIEIRQGARGRGRIVIHFADHDEFQRLLCQLTGSAGPAAGRDAA